MIPQLELCRPRVDCRRSSFQAEVHIQQFVLCDCDFTALLTIAMTLHDLSVIRGIIEAATGRVIWSVRDEGERMGGFIPKSEEAQRPVPRTSCNSKGYPNTDPVRRR